MAGALLLAPLVAIAEPATSPAHSIANRFAEDAQRADAQRKEAAQRQAQQRKEQAAKAARDKAQKAYETEMLARARAEAEERRKLEEQAARLDALRAEREARDAEAERQRVEKARQIEAAREVEQARVAAEARKAEEAKRAAEAQRIAAEKLAAEEAARKADEARIAEEARKAQETARLAETARKAEEERRLEAARRIEENARLAEAARKADEALKVAEEQKAREAQRLAAERAAAEEARRSAARVAAEHSRRVTDIEADAEIARVAESLRRIRDEHLAKRTGPPVDTPTPAITGTIAERKVEPSSGQGRLAVSQGYRDVPLAPPRARAGIEPPARVVQEPKLAFDGHVTVLLKMEPRYRRGRGHESMDPVLCTADGCYVSNGPDQPAAFLHGNRAVRFGNAIGRRAGACNHAYTCVFRNVDLGALPADLQPVDIRVIRHDRREPERIEALSDCRVGAGGRVACTGTIQGDGYTMWVISEAAAEELAHTFGSAFDGEPRDSAEMDPKLNPWRDRW